MRLDYVVRHGFRILVFLAVIVVVMGCSSETPSTILPTSSALSCNASGTAVSTATGSTISVSNVSVTISAGTGPFSITLPGAGAVTSSSPSYTYQGTLSVTTDASGYSSSYVGVSDQSTGASTSCLLSVSGTGTGTGTGTGGYYPGYPTTGYVTCTLQFNVGYYYPGQTIPFWISTSDGESAYLTSLSTGEPYATQPTFPIWAPFYIRYSWGGPKQITLTASTASGIPCNGGQQISDSIFINYY